MAKPRVFISSTFYDLKQIRADLNMFIENLGYETIRNEEGNIPYGKDKALEEYCYKEIKNIDILVSIIGGRYGSESKREKSSISQIELRTALKEEKQVYIFIEKNVLSEYETYLLNKENEKTIYKYVDNLKIYKFIEEVKNLNANNNIKSFETASEITHYLKEQFAGLFQSFLENQRRVKEVSIIDNLEKTAFTLNKLVNYISNENIEKDTEINQILSLNHPLVEKVRENLQIEYSFYIEGFNDLNKLLEARGYTKDEFDEIFSDNTPNEYYWLKETERKNIKITISKEIFENNKLKFIKKNEWKEEYFLYQTSDKEIEIPDDLPF
ncbi:DUF4062 domain-containing protein [Tenacibaculum sp. S7007]|uniref:DUF4062 domain-containing protein n=1 Tax=Tenacibaculum pelagium TaxID=2759527 RepID=A0A839APK6_9FLAO|nr:DUF4062 domain-containing protein [Tenacibaculum pelagium]MBA6157025.1 DUF4062 domain-containing protein [Tenacibaculum pelagium]